MCRRTPPAPAKSGVRPTMIGRRLEDATDEQGDDDPYQGSLDPGKS
jgi:hypothetical protein